MIFDEEIIKTLGRLARGQFNGESDWKICFRFVRTVILDHRLPATEYAPSSRFGGKDWTVDDFAEIAHDWIVHIRGDRAGRLIQPNREGRHLVNGIRRSVYHFVLDQRSRSPRSDLWAAMNEVMREFAELLQQTGQVASETHPNLSFPFETSDTRISSHRRSVSASEVRAALHLIAADQPQGWTLQSLHSVLADWANIGKSIQHTVEAIGEHGSGKDISHAKRPESRLAGHDLAKQVLAKLTTDERKLLGEVLIPISLGELTIEAAAARLEMAKSTLYDRVNRLRAKLNQMDTNEFDGLDVEALRSFFDQIRAFAGNEGGDAGIKKEGAS